MIVAIRIAFKRCWKLLEFQNLFHQTCLPLHSYRLQVNLNFLISIHSNLRRNTFSSIQINMIWIVRLWVMRLEKVFRGIIFIGWDGGFYYKSWQIVKRFLPSLLIAVFFRPSCLLKMVQWWVLLFLYAKRARIIYKVYLILCLFMQICIEMRWRRLSCYSIYGCHKIC